MVVVVRVGVAIERVLVGYIGPVDVDLVVLVVYDGVMTVGLGRARSSGLTVELVTKVHAVKWRAERVRELHDDQSDVGTNDELVINSSYALE